MFTFSGSIESSKSWMNRALIIQNYNPQIEILGGSQSDDVKNLKSSILSLKNGESEFFSGAGGTTLRFFSFLISRKPGLWKIHADQRLLERPQTELKQILNQLGVEVTYAATCVTLKSSGWVLPKVIHCSGRNSSQFVSGLLLNSWQLPQDLVIELPKPVASWDYLRMTIEMVKSLNLKIEIIETESILQIKILAMQQPMSLNSLLAEPDISSAFALAVAGAIAGHVHITDWPKQSLQPDFNFLNIFKKMGILFEVEKNIFKIQQQKTWNKAEENLKNTPDLFPALSVLCALGDGISYLYGADNLKAKESNRFSKTEELLNLCGFKTEIKNDGLIIFGKSSSLDKKTLLDFDPDQDHRMAMAAGLMKLAGFNVRISNSSVVSKSYPNFWQDIQVSV